MPWCVYALFHHQEAAVSLTNYYEELLNETLQKFYSCRDLVPLDGAESMSPTVGINCLKDRLKGIKTTIKAFHMSLSNTIILLTIFHKDRHKNLQ